MLQTIKKDLVSFQWEKSFSVTKNKVKIYHFGINRISESSILAIPFIANCFNKLIYFYKESEDAQQAHFKFYFENNNSAYVNLVKNILTEIFLPCKRFTAEFQAHADNDTDFNMMIKFLKG